MKRADFNAAAIKALANGGKMSSTQLIQAISDGIGEVVKPPIFYVRIKYLEVDKIVASWDSKGLTPEEKRTWRGRAMRYYFLSPYGQQLAARAALS